MSSNTPFLLFADRRGTIYTHPYLKMTGQSLDKLVVPGPCELIAMPAGSSLFYLPDRYPVGFDPRRKAYDVLQRYQGKKVHAVAAFSIPAILRLYNPAAVVHERTNLPLWAYTACGFYGGRYYIAARRVDRRIRQSPRFYRAAIIRNRVQATLKQYPHNRLYRHLAHCALNYNCLAAKNLFMRRWEAPLPAAPSCNARCIGCLSQQEGDCIASHARIGFRPGVAEIAEVMSHHLAGAREAIVSFGQGCEGEPLMEAGTIARAIAGVRSRIQRGTINMNTNASIPAKVRLLCEAGIDSFRVSLNSPQKKYYELYFRPRGYSYSDVLRSIEIAKKYKKFVSINLFVFPGFTDSSQQVKALRQFIKRSGIDMIQWRNLNIDPQRYLERFPHEGLHPQGILELIAGIAKEFPHLKTGYFNLPKEQFGH